MKVYQLALLGLLLQQGTFYLIPLLGYPLLILGRSVFHYLIFLQVSFLDLNHLLFDLVNLAVYFLLDFLVLSLLNYYLVFGHYYFFSHLYYQHLHQIYYFCFRYSFVFVAYHYFWDLRDLRVSSLGSFFD